MGRETVKNVVNGGSAASDSHGVLKENHPMNTRRTWMGTVLSAFAFLCLCTPVFAQSTEHSLLLPESISEAGDEIDSLFWFVFWLVGIVFVGTEGLLIYFIIKYRAKEGGKAHYTHGNYKAELIWTATPAAILLFLAVFQFGTWQKLKDPELFPTAEEDNAVQVHVLAQQFAWNFRYQGPDGVWGTEDDFTVENELIVPKDRPVVLQMRTIDVIHSLYVPVLRFKQDLVPGLTMTSWFEARKAGKYEIACAELCGASHYLMRANMTVLEQDEWDAECKKLSDAQGGIDYESPTQNFRFWRPEEFENR